MAEMEGLEVESVMMMKERVGEAQRIAKLEMREMEERQKGNGGGAEDRGGLEEGEGGEEPETDARLGTRAGAIARGGRGRGGGRGTREGTGTRWGWQGRRRWKGRERPTLSAECQCINESHDSAALIITSCMKRALSTSSLFTEGTSPAWGGLVWGWEG